MTSGTQITSETDPGGPPVGAQIWQDEGLGWPKVMGRGVQIRPKKLIGLIFSFYFSISIFLSYLKNKSNQV